MQTQEPSILPLYSSGLDDPALMPLVRQYAHEMTDVIRELQNGLASNDRDGLRRRAHRLRGSAGGYGFPTVASAAGALEIAATCGNSNNVAERVNRLLLLCRRVCHAYSAVNEECAQ